MIFKYMILIALISVLTVVHGRENYTIVVHGGAGIISKEIPEELQQRYLETLDSALNIGARVLSNGGNALDAVEKVINYLEDCELYNAGKGSVFNFEGNIDLDASIMDGNNLMAGAVSGVKRIKNPISAARKVMENTPHVILSGAGADMFAEDSGLEMVSNTYFHTKSRFEAYEKAKQQHIINKHGTVGCVVLDQNGNLAAGTSTGGMTLKRWGRIGDSPIIGAGTYADNLSCAVSCTGHGEYFIRLGIARDLAARLEYKKVTIEEAAIETIEKLTKKGGTGGLIAVDKNGSPVMVFNTPGMFRGYIKANGEKEISIF